MKTTQILERPFIKGTKVRQNHKTKYFNANDLLDSVNLKRSKKANKKGKLLRPKRIDSYFALQGTKEFLEELSIEENLPINELVIAKGGRNGGTWVHPLVMLDIALWSDAKLKVQVYKWIYDNLALFRDNGGDSFKEMNTALLEAYPRPFKRPYTYAQVANKIGDAVGLPREKNRWNNATEGQLKHRDKIQDALVTLAGVVPDLNECLNMGIEKCKKYKGVL